MPWIYLTDNYVEDEKMLALSDGSFRLWHEAIAYCRRHQTDGLISFTTMRAFRYYTKGREKQLATANREGVAPLWELIPALGYKIHNFLEWNPSREEEDKERAGAKGRMRRYRDKRQRYGVTNGVTNGVIDAEVPVRSGTDHSFEEAPTEEKKEKPPSVLEQRFQEFWAGYPRKVGKDAAWRAWQKRKPDGELLAKMLATIRWQVQTPDWRKDGGQYIPHPSTWLNQGRWDDEQPGAAATSAVWRCPHQPSCTARGECEIKRRIEAGRVAV